MKKTILLFILLIKAGFSFACKTEAGSLLLEANTTYARDSFFIMLIGILVHLLLLKTDKLKHAIILCIVSFIHPYIWFKNYDDCGSTLKNISLSYSAIVIVALVLLYVIKTIRNRKNVS